VKNKIERIEYNIINGNFRLRDDLFLNSLRDRKLEKVVLKSIKRRTDNNKWVYYRR